MAEEKERAEEEMEVVVKGVVVTVGAEAAEEVKAVEETVVGSEVAAR